MSKKCLTQEEIEKRRIYNREYGRKRRGFKGPRIYKYPITPGLPVKERMQEIRYIVLKHYSKKDLPECTCCGEKELKFLSIDHVNGGGNAHRKTIANGKGGNLAYWLLRNELPEGYQTLCHNCNMAKGFYGACPHKT